MSQASAQPEGKRSVSKRSGGGRKGGGRHGARKLAASSDASGSVASGAGNGAGGGLAARAVPPVDPAERALREREELAADKERLALWSHEEATRALNTVVMRFIRVHNAAVLRIEETHAGARRRASIRLSTSVAELKSLRSPTARRLLKPDLKKGIGLAKRAQAVTSETLEGLLRDVASTSLTRYAGEIAVAMGASDSLRPENIDAIVSLAVALHQRYTDFACILVQTVLAGIAHAVDITHIGAPEKGVTTASGAVPSNPILSAVAAARARYPIEVDVGGEGSGVTASGITSAAKEAVTSDPKTAASRLRFLFRLFTELFTAGIITDAEDLLSIFLALLGEPAKEAASACKKARSSKSNNGAAPDAIVTLSSAAARTPFLVEIAAPEAANDSAAAATVTEEAAPAPSQLLPWQVSMAPVTDRVAKRAVRELPLVLGLLRASSNGLSFAEDILGIVSRSTRLWSTTSLPRVNPGIGDATPTSGDNVYLTAWARARQGAEPSAAVRTQIHSYEVALNVMLKNSSASTSDTSMVIPFPLPSASALFSHEQQLIALRSCERYFDAVCRALVIETLALRKAERRAELARFSKAKKDDKGDAGSDVDTLRASQERLLSGCTALADVLDRVLPVLPESASDLSDGAAMGNFTIWAAGSSFGATGFGAFDDAASYAFYCEIPNLRETHPGVLLDPDTSSSVVNTSSGGAPEGLSQDASARGGALPGARAGSRFDSHGRGRGDLNSALKQLTSIDQSISSTSTSSPITRAAAVTLKPAVPATSAPPTEAIDADDDADDGGPEFKPSADLVAMLSHVDDDSGPSSGDAAARNAAGLRFIALLNSLSSCGSLEAVDTWASEFILGKFNTKNHRARLLKRLFEAPSTSVELIPFFSRLAAVLETGLNEFAKPLVSLLDEQLRFLCTSKRRSMWDAKARTIRFLGELVKFNLCPPVIVFKCAVRLMKDASPSNLQLVTVLLEVCGRFLYLSSPATHSAMVRLLDELKRTRDECGHVRGSPLWDSIEAAYFTCVPSDALVRKARVRAPFHAFLRHLLLDRLSAATLDDTLKTMRRLPWNDQTANIELYVIKTVLTASAANVDCARVELIVSLLAGLRQFYDGAIIAVIDALQLRMLSCLSGGGRLTVLPAGPDAPGERCAVPFDVPSLRAKVSQRAIGAARMLAECYNYKLCDSSVIFNSLFTLINHGHATPQDIRRAAVDGVNALLAATLSRADAAMAAGAPDADAEALLDLLPHAPLPMPPTNEGLGGWGFHPSVACASDPPSSMLRVRMVCALLDACGPFFRAGTHLGSRLDRFLVYFQRYLAFKEMPIDTEWTVSDIFTSLRPSLARMGSKEEAERFAGELEREEAYEAADDEEQESSSVAKGGAAGVLCDVDEEDDDDGDEDDEEDDEDGGDEEEAGDDDMEEACEEDDEGGSEGEDVESDASDEENGDDDDASSSSSGAAAVDKASDFFMLRGGKNDKRSISAEAAVDEDYERAFSLMMSESLESGRAQVATARTAADHMTVPIGYAAAAATSESDSNGSAVALTLLKRRGTKGPGGGTGGAGGAGSSRIDARTLLVPKTAELARAAARAAAAQRAEVEELAKRTLALHEASQLAEANDHIRRPRRQ